MATRNRYAEIMAQYAQSQPFSFFGYPESYTGGYDVAQPQAYAAPVTRYEEIMAQQAMGGGGRGEREAPSTFSQMTPAERAAYYSQNPTEGKLALLAQDYFSSNPFGFISKLTNPDGWYDSRLEKMGVNPTISLDTQNQLAGEAMQKALYPTGGFVAVTPQQAAEAAAVAQAAQAAEAARQPITESSQLNVPLSGGRSGGGGYSGAPSGGSDVGRSPPGSAHSGQQGYAQGGYVSMQHLGGPDPEGPDDGYAALKDGEFVINDKAVKKYGIELMQAINSGKISKGKLRGLLEM